jgi:hypothetical protein
MYTLKARKSEGAALPKMKPHFHRENVMIAARHTYVRKRTKLPRESPLRAGRAAGLVRDHDAKQQFKKLAGA